jgi:hypothetical protein
MCADVQRLTALVESASMPPSSRLFSPPRRELAALYELILGTSHASLARLVLDAYRTDPPDDSAACALVAPGWGDRDRDFLARVMRERRAGRESTELHQMAANVLVSALARLPALGRTQPWALSAIRSLGTLRDPHALGLITQILNGRRWFVFWQWPKPCRDAAARAQARRNLIDLGYGAGGRNGR